MNASALSWKRAARSLPAGAAGTILTRPSAGGGWTKSDATAAADSDLRDLCLAASGEVVAVGAKGIAIVSADGGQSWSLLNLGAVVDFNACTGSGGSALVAAGDAGTILRFTADGTQVRRGQHAVAGGSLRAGERQQWPPCLRETAASSCAPRTADGTGRLQASGTDRGPLRGRRIGRRSLRRGPCRNHPEESRCRGRIVVGAFHRVHPRPSPTPSSIPIWAFSPSTPTENSS